MEILHRHLEALIFCANEPVSLIELQKCLTDITGTELELETVEKAVIELQNFYDAGEYSFSIAELAGGFQFLTKPAYQASISILLKNKSKKKLSTSALETLSIIAYKQPVTKSQIEHIRGVNSDYALQKLLERELIEIQGKADSPGRPVLYGTGKKFMEYFGINSLKDLPQPKEFTSLDSEIGEPAGE